MPSNAVGFQFSSVLNGVIWALLVSIVMSIIVTLILHFSTVPESLLPAFATLIFFLSIFSGSIVSAKKAGNMGLVHGLSVGLIYLIVSLVLALFVVTNAFAWILLFKKLFYTIIASSLGGIIGIGLANQK